MTSRFKQVVEQYADPTSIVGPGWSAFVSAMVEAYEHDIQWVIKNAVSTSQANGVQRDGKQGGLPAKDLKPILFDSNVKTKLTFKEWSKDLNAWVKNIDSAYKDMLPIAAKVEGEWNAAEYQRQVIDQVDKIDELNYDDFDGSH